MLIHTGTRSVDFTDNVGHASFVPQEGSEMDRLAGVILGKALHLAPVPATALAGQEAQRPVPRSRELAVRLETENKHLVLAIEIHLYPLKDQGPFSSCLLTLCIYKTFCILENLLIISCLASEFHYVLRTKSSGPNHTVPRSPFKLILRRY